MDKQSCVRNNYHISREISTGMRALAITFVILAHVLNHCVGSSMSKLSGLLGTGGVWIFLILSGYGLYCSYDKKGIHPKNFWKGKIQKIFVPYIIITFVYYLWLQISGVKIGVIKLAENLLCIDFSRSIDGTMWYMNFLLIWYVIFFVAFYFKVSPVIKLIFLFACGYYFRTGHAAMIFKDCNWQFVTNAYAFPVGVLLGYVLCNLNRIQKSSIKVKTEFVSYILFGVCVAIYICGYLEILELSYGQFGLLLFVIIYNSVSFITNQMVLLSKGLNLIGKHAYFLYLVEGKCISILGNSRFFNNSLFFIIGLIIMLAVTVAIYEKGRTVIKKY